MVVLLLHGLDGFAGIHWQQWLHDTLIVENFSVLMPSLPNASHPSRGEWLRYLQHLVKGVYLPGLVIVAHSLGVPAALDLIEQSETEVKGLLSVSGFADNYGSTYNDYYMKEKEIDFSLVNQHLGKRSVVFGDDDPYVPQKSLYLLAENLHVKPIIIHKGGHLNSESGYKEFPLLLDLIQQVAFL